MEKAQEIFEFMKNNSDVAPDLITFSTLIKGHCRAKNIEAALVLH